MNWIEVKITTATENLDNVSDALYAIDVTEFVISDKEDFKEFLENNRKYWDYVDETLEELKTADSCITVYLSDDPEGKANLEKIKAAIEELKNKGIQNLALHTADVKDEDWSENWKQYYKPIEVGKKVVIVPEWESVPDTDRVKFIINPGCSFGTGSHESTRMCIEEMEKYLSRGDEILDLGCGSGILSVIGLLIGAKEATAVDIDPMAVETAYSNLKLNDLPQSIYHGYAGDVTSDNELRAKLAAKKCDIVLANIVADVIISLSGYVKEFMKDTGVFICSGIIIERKDEVRLALENAGLEIIEERTMGEWAAYTAKLKG
ncbi:MAG: 50S ribosomal protein L11 methyltransferase [Clostridia bacterium]|nr:50S ribosomal protein L11 methyltransferase [Clostridia bacterium]